MSTLNSNGIKITWRLENFHMEECYNTTFDFKWPSSNKVMKLVFANVIKPEIRIPLVDLELFGTISVVTAINSIYLLNQFEYLDLEKELKGLDLSSLKDLKCEKNILFPNNILTLRIHLWDSPMKTTSICFQICSKWPSRKCFLRWMLDIDADTKGYPWAKYCKSCPSEFTNYKSNTISSKMVLKIEKLSDSSSFITQTDDKNYITIDTLMGTWIKCKLEAIGNDGSFLQLLNSQWHYTKPIFRESLNFKSLQILKSEKQKYDTNGFITLNCFIEIAPFLFTFADIVTVDYISEALSPPVIIEIWHGSSIYLSENKISHETLSNSMYNLYKNGRLCDVALQANNKTFRCHKAVLCARSQVFTAMFENDMKEKQTEIVTIEDVEAPILNMFLEAIYTDTLNNISWEDAIKLYMVSDKYDVSALKKLYSDFLLTCLSNENICDLFELCEAHLDEDLKSKTEKFFLKNAIEIINLQSWRNFMVNKPLSAAELLLKHANYANNKQDQVVKNFFSQH